MFDVLQKFVDRRISQLSMGEKIKVFSIAADLKVDFSELELLQFFVLSDLSFKTYSKVLANEESLKFLREEEMQKLLDVIECFNGSELKRDLVRSIF